MALLTGPSLERLRPVLEASRAALEALDATPGSPLARLELARQLTTHAACLSAAAAALAAEAHGDLGRVAAAAVARAASLDDPEAAAEAVAEVFLGMVAAAVPGEAGARPEWTGAGGRREDAAPSAGAARARS